MYNINRSNTTLKTVEDLKKMHEEDPELKIINLLHEPNYTENIVFITEKMKKDKLLASIEKTMEGKEFNRMIVIPFKDGDKNILILAQIYMQGQ